jgi:ubiquinone/menaquinone biosynthesis C-methylase UbiE
MGTGYEFVGLRSKLYKEALAEYPHAREEEIQIMHRYLSPEAGQHILGLGEGNGFFCEEIAKAVGSHGKYLVTDPSQDQLNSLIEKFRFPQVEVQVMGAEGVEVSPKSFDRVWSNGAFHHCLDQTKTMQNIYKALKPGGKAIICDAFQKSPVAKHFDTQAARYTETGHEVKFLSEEFAGSICYLAGFRDEKVEIVDLPQKWCFDSEYDIGVFIYKLNAMTKLKGTEQQKIEQTLEGCRNILGIEYEQGMYKLNWPLKAIVAEK